MPTYIVPSRPASWVELFWALIFGFGLGVVLTIAFSAGIASAGGSVTVNWDQSADCAAISGWELSLKPITSADPNPQPTGSPLGATILNSGVPAPVCGLGMKQSVTLSNAGVGPYRFWLRAFGGTTKSDFSNFSDATLPFAAPGGLKVVVP